MTEQETEAAGESSDPREIAPSASHGAGTEVAAPEPTPEPIPEPIPEPAPEAPASAAPAVSVPVLTVSSILKKGLESIRFRKRGKLEKVVALAREKGNITNDDVQLTVQVSDATATRYLSQLVREGRLQRAGTPEHSVYRPL